ncbi:Ltp family lipoprotein [Staphylococcus americanisciuri]|uniref:Ltp family lipoprotein n=1 Tax=Staphylococcus americanisciuri TaxID=2973940 RepID=UPI00278C47B7|nr:Ltp family lipoprotein [Staphylococcus americanisciuri]
MSNNPTNQRNEKLRQEQFETWQQNKPSNSKKWWLIGCGVGSGCLLVIILIFVGSAILFTAIIETDNEANIQEYPEIIQDSKTQKPAFSLDDSSNKEKSNDSNRALEKAKIYSDTLYMSKQGIYDQLTSEYGGNYTEEAAQYAIDHLKADYKENALKAAKSYQKNFNMSKNKIYDQLTSQFGEKYTEEEAQYAIDHLK